MVPYTQAIHTTCAVLTRHTILLNNVRSTLLQNRHVCQDGHDLEKRIEELRKQSHKIQMMLSIDRVARATQCPCSPGLLTVHLIPSFHGIFFHPHGLLPLRYSPPVKMPIHQHMALGWSPKDPRTPNKENSITLGEAGTQMPSCRASLDPTPKMQIDWTDRWSLCFLCTGLSS